MGENQVKVQSFVCKNYIEGRLAGKVAADTFSL